ncbi:MAG: O-antigen ligase family protein [Chitinophagaceae bacterium]
MRWSERLDTAQQYAILLVTFSLTLRYNLNTACIWLLLATWLFSLKFKSTWRHYAAQPVYWVWAAFFFLNAASYFWSVDKDRSVFDTVSKLVLVLFPVVLGAGANICAKRLEQILVAFILTITATGIFSLVNAALRWQVDGHTSHFFYHDLVAGQAANAVYTGWYAFTALSAILLGNWNYYFKGYWQVLKWACAALLMVFLVLLSSRLLLVVFILLVIPAHLYKLIIHSKRPWVKIVLIIATASSLVAAFSLTGNPIEKRYRAVMNRNIHIAFLPEYRDTIPHFNNLTLRLFVWRCGIDNIKEHNLWLKGCGNGDTHTIQNEKFAALGLNEEYQKKSYNIIQGINLHNMYMEAFVSLGIPGLLLIIAIVFLPFFYLKKSSQISFFAAFHIVSLLFMMQESALQTQSGIIFWAFFSCLFWQDVKRRGNKTLKMTLNG